MKKYHLYGAVACGSALAELFMVSAKIPYVLTELNWETRVKWKKIFGKYNPLLQVPTLVIDDKQVLTESLAIAKHCDERGGQLIPKGKHADEFWRWAILIVSNIYPTFTYADNAAEFVRGKPNQDFMQKKVLQRRKRLWKQLEENAQGPWFLGKQFSAIDIYISVMINWKPGKTWFKKNCPKLSKIAEHFTKGSPQKAILKRHFK